MSETPITPAPEPTPAPEAPKPAPPGQEPVATAPVEPANPWDNPESAKAEIERLRRENGKDRTTAKQTAAAEAEAALAQKIGAALGLIKADEPADPAKLTEQLTATQAEAQRARVELAVFKNAGDIGDPSRLLDSQTFLAKVKGLDPSDTEAVKAAIKDAVEANPWLGATAGNRLPAPNPAQGSSGSGSHEPGQLSQTDVQRMYAAKDYAGIEKARQEGRLANILGA